MIVLGGISLDMLSSARAFVGGESLWAKGQKEAFHSLGRYAQTHAEADYRRYEENIAVSLGDRKARLELSKADPDPALVRRGFLEGRNHPDDIAGMVRLFRRFKHVSFMARAIDIWTAADER
ncbi:MAG: EAL domain-containing protein, partial [Burkholderiaceae bacterium]